MRRGNMTRGIRTTEFWMSAITGIMLSALTIAVGYGYMTSEQSEMWQPLILGLVSIALALIPVGYANSRAKVKESTASSKNTD